jgi:hypothetical protein
MKLFNCLKVLLLCLVLAAAPVLFSTAVQAFVYDDFTNTGIDANLWSDRSPDINLFSQPGDGYLYFQDQVGGQADRLRSCSRQADPFFVAMRFCDFQAENDSQGQFQGSGPVLIIGDTINSVAIYEYIDRVATPQQGFRVKTTINGRIWGSHIIPSNAASAWLGIGYNGSTASFWFDDGSGWQQFQIDPPVKPEFSDEPFFFIKGANEYGHSLSFRVDQVQVRPLLDASPIISAIQDDLLPMIQALDDTAVVNVNTKKTLENKLNLVKINIMTGNYADALGQLQHDLLGKVDGIATTGAPDKNDWIKDYAPGKSVYDSLILIIDKLKVLLGQS